MRVWELLSTSGGFDRVDYSLHLCLLRIKFHEKMSNPDHEFAMSEIDALEEYQSDVLEEGVVPVNPEPEPRAEMAAPPIPVSFEHLATLLVYECIHLILYFTATGGRCSIARSRGENSAHDGCDAQTIR